MQYCVNCGTKNDDNSHFCTKCGAELTSQNAESINEKPKVVYCTKCGAENKSGSRFCTKCGTELTANNEAGKVRNAPVITETNPHVYSNQNVDDKPNLKFLIEDIWEWLKSSWAGLLLIAIGLITITAGSEQLESDENLLVLYIVSLILFIAGIVFLDLPGYVRLILIGISFFILLNVLNSGAIVAISIILIASGLIYYFWIVKPYDDITDTSLSPNIYVAIGGSIFFALSIYNISSGDEIGWSVFGLILCAVLVPFAIYGLYKNLKKAEKSQNDENSDEDHRLPDVLRRQLFLSLAMCAALILTILIGSATGGARPTAIVRNTYFPQYSTEMTIGEALDKSFNDPKWSSRSIDGRELVDFYGIIYKGDEPANVHIIFNAINGEPNIFFVYINGEMMNPVDENDFFTQIYELAEG